MTWRTSQMGKGTSWISLLSFISTSADTYTSFGKTFVQFENWYLLIYIIWLFHMTSIKWDMDARETNDFWVYWGSQVNRLLNRLSMSYELSMWLWVGLYLKMFQKNATRVAPDQCRNFEIATLVARVTHWQPLSQEATAYNFNQSIALEFNQSIAPNIHYNKTL
jgi:hypothetical protein